jgi:excinuclease UvrABC nuclease subunit
MATQSYQLNFDGYWREPTGGGLPDKSGIYGVYAGVYNQAVNTVTLNRLLYIGEAADMRGRVANHERLPEWKRQLKAGEVLCFNAALISPEAARQRADAAMIFKHKPPCNTEYVDSFPFDTTTVTTTGSNALMQVSFTVTRTEKASTLLYGRRW